MKEYGRTTELGDVNRRRGTTLTRAIPMAIRSINGFGFRLKIGNRMKHGSTVICDDWWGGTLKKGRN